MEAHMAFPDCIERTVEIARPPSRVWAALTTAEGLGAWFGDRATIDLRPGGAAQVEWKEGPTADIRVERLPDRAAAERMVNRGDRSAVVVLGHGRGRG